MAYLIVHFREKRTPDGEQVYFALSHDGYSWQEVNGGRPVLWAYYGEKGVRDHTIARLHDGRFVIVSTDLSLSYGMRGRYHNSWAEVSSNGSKCLSMWESEDLIHWSEQRLQFMGDEGFGCCWAPEITEDPGSDDFILHWTSSHAMNGYRGKRIMYSRTKDFRSFTAPEVLYDSPCGDVIDSALYFRDGVYWLFARNGRDPEHVRMLKSTALTGPYEPIPAFDEEIEKLGRPCYEAPTCYRLSDGRWCLLLDYYGVPGAGQGYVPFVADTLESGRFIRSDALFSFPYGFKHGTVLEISDEEYARIAGAAWE